MEKYYGFGSDASAEQILKVTKLLQHWTAGLHGVGMAGIDGEASG